MNNKVKTLLVIAASAALTGCSFTPTTGSTGPVTEESAPEIQGLYAEALENNESLEEITESETSEENSESAEEESESAPEESIPEESEEESSEPEESEPEESEPEESEPEEEPSIEDTITSYHVDYSYEYGLKASVEGYTIMDLYEKESYSLTYVNDEDGLFLEMNLSHEYKENAYCYGSETVSAIFQDGILYVDSSISVGEYTYELSKDSYKIGGHHIYGEFGDFFRYTTNDLLLDSTGKESSYELLATLIASENVEVTAAEGNLITITIEDEGVITTLTFDTELELFTGATIDESAAILAAYQEMAKNDVVSIDEAIAKTALSYTYNSSIANRLTEEEIAEYSHNYMDYGHNNDHHGYGEGGHHGGHGHDHDGWDDEDWWEDDRGHDNGGNHGQEDPWGDHNHEDWDDEEGSDDDWWDDFWGDDSEQGDDSEDENIEVGGTDTSSYDEHGHGRP